MGSSRSRRIRRQSTIRGTAALLSAIGIVGVTAACGSDDSGGRSATDLVLTQGELPDGFTVAKLGKDELQQVTDQLHDSTKNVTVSPKQCAAPGEMPTAVDPKKSGVMAATTSSYSISQSVQAVDDVDGGVDLARTRDRFTGQCATARVEVTAGPIKGATIDVRRRVLSTQDIDADQLLVVESDSHTVNGAKSGTENLLTGSAVVNGYLVTVEMANVDEGGTLDRDLFTDILRRAVDKIAA